jgi:hypothetical protein
MPIFAVCPRCVTNFSDIERNTSGSVFGDRHGFQMIWIDTTTDPTEVINHQTIWYWAFG